MTSDTDDSSLTDQQSKKTPVWLWPNLLSLDAPLVAVLWMGWFAASLQIKMPAGIYWALGLTVWLIYVADRLFDGFRLKSVEMATPRHRFYRKYALVFVFLLPAGLALDLWLAYHYVPMGMLRTGGLLAFFVAAYFVFRFVLSRHPQAGAPRELLCGFVFAVGTVMAVYFYSGEEGQAFFLTPHPVMLAILFSANCVAIAHWEAESDRANDDASLATTVPTTVRDLPVLLGLLALAAAGMLVFDWPGYGEPIIAAILLSGLLLLALIKLEKRFSVNALRVLADVVLVLPMIPLIAFIP